MSVTLKKGGNLSLSKAEPDLRVARVGLGWDTRSGSGVSYDLDASAFLLGPNERARSDADFIFYNQLASPCGSVAHQGDNRTGEGDGDDEVLLVDLPKIPEAVSKIAVCVSIHDATARKQSFGQVSNAFIRVANEETGREIARYDLSEDASTETAMIFGEIYRDGSGGWKFRAVGQGFAGGLGPLARNYGINVE